MTNVDHVKNEANYDNYFTEELVFLDKCWTDYEALFKVIGARLNRLGFVTPHFVEALLEREARYPTGLPTKIVGVAIPHTDPVNIIKPFVAIARPLESVAFRQMGTANGEMVDAGLIFVLGMARAVEQVPLLQKVMQVVVDENALKALLQTSNPQQTIHCFLEFSR